jgi:divalent metal cation (Fe/Co/Zn/Cd) transporter
MTTDVFTRSNHLKKAIRLEFVTISWNILEGFAAIASGSIAGSIALIGFGVDSLIETSSGTILLWRLREELSGHDGEKLEKRALKMVGICFVALAAYVSLDSIQTLVSRERPEHSMVGITISILSLIVMPLLANKKRNAAAGLSSAALKADSRQTSLCAYLSAILLVGLLLNALVGWWWADPVAALAMVPVILREALKAIKGETCSACN